MSYQSHALQQGSAEWLQFRARSYGASDAAAMLGLSHYKTRAELLREKATGATPQVDASTQARFDRGHAIEAFARLLADEHHGSDFYPSVLSREVNGMMLSASLDGITMDDACTWECKTMNAELRESLPRGVIPAQYHPQLEQGLLISGADSCLFTGSDGTTEGTLHAIYRSHPELRAAIIAGWQQFDADLAAYVPEPVKAAPVAAPVEGFGILSLRVEGRVLASNLDSFRAGAEAFISRLPKPQELQTDQDFVNADAAVKACADAESRIKAAKDAALAEMADVDAVLRAADAVIESIRAARLALDKVVKAEKENRKADMISGAAFEIGDYCAKLNANLAVGVILADPKPSIAAAIKGLKSLKSIEDAAAQVVASAKIAASAEAERHRANLAALADAGRAELFSDRDALVRSKTPDDLRNLIAARIAEADAREKARLEAERERIRQEEQAKAHAMWEAQRQADAEKRAANESLPAVAGAAEAPAAAEAPPVQAQVAADRPGAMLKLGDINQRIAPVSITADGLKALGFLPASKQGASLLYAEADFHRICKAIGGRLRAAMEAHPATGAAPTSDVLEMSGRIA